MKAELFFVVLVLGVSLAMNVWASVLVLRDQYSESTQRALQLLAVWVLPLFGAVIVFALHRQVEKGDGKYREIPDLGGDYGYSRRASNRTSDAADVD